MPGFFKRGKVYTVSPPIEGHDKLMYVESNWFSQDGIVHQFISTKAGETTEERFKAWNNGDENSVDIPDKDVNYPRPYTMKYTMEETTAGGKRKTRRKTRRGTV